MIMTEIRTYTIPLRSEFRETERYNKTKRAMKGIRKYVEKHMKTEDVKIGSSVNLQMWTRGGQNPPHKITVVVEKNADGVVFVELEQSALPSEVAKVEAAKEKESKKESKKSETPAVADEKSSEAPAKKTAKTPSKSTQE